MHNVYTSGTIALQKKKKILSRQNQDGGSKREYLVLFSLGVIARNIVKHIIGYVRLKKYSVNSRSKWQTLALIHSRLEVTFSPVRQKINQLLDLFHKSVSVVFFKR